MGALSDLSGRVFGRLRAESLAMSVGPMGARRPSWRCRCVCGAENAIVPAKSLRSGVTRSCGCLRRDTDAARIARMTKHGCGSHRKGRLPEYNSWSMMRARCNAPSCPSFPDYGGRGITVCARWDDFEVFLADMGPRPTLRHTLDRIDVNGNYEPANCRWATPRQQAYNTRRTRYITINGVTRPLGEWSLLCKVARSVIYRRLSRGLTGADLITPPPPNALRTAPSIIEPDLPRR